MTCEEAIARFRARWDHPPLDPIDVAERLALRGVDAAVIATPPACRVFVHSGRGWSSRYVHTAHDVDEALDALGATHEPASAIPPDASSIAATPPCDRGSAPTRASTGAWSSG